MSACTVSRNCHYLLSALLFSALTAVTARAACENATGTITSFQVLDSPASRSGTFEIGYSFSGNPSERVVNVYRNGEHWQFANNLGTSGVVTLDNNVFCRHGDYEFKAVPYTGCTNQVVSEAVVTKHYDSRPRVAISEVTFTVNEDGTPLVNVAVDYEFPYQGVALPQDKIIDIYVDGTRFLRGNVFSDEPWQGHKTFTTGFGCLATGTHTIVAQAIGCGMPSDSEPVTFKVKNPDISIVSVEPTDAFGGFAATIDYQFETTRENSNERRIDLYWNGQLTGGTSALARQGQVTLHFNRGCMITPGTAQDNLVKAVAIGCNRPSDPAFRDEAETQVKLPTEAGTNQTGTASRS